MTAGWRTSPRLKTFLLVCVASGLGLGIAAAQGVVADGGNRDAFPREVVLHQQVVPYDLDSAYWNLGATNRLSLKEPELSKQNVFRSVWRFGKQDTNNAMAVIWDQPKGRLYLDLNRNLDLTDDPAGVFSSANKGPEQSFTNVTVFLRTTAGLHPAILNLRLWSDGVKGQMHGQLYSRSLWEAKVGPPGKEWQVAALDDPFNPEGPTFARFLLLRPWTARTNGLFNRLYLRDVTSGIVRFPDQLFWLGEAFRLERRFENQDGTPVCKLEFTPQQPPLTEVNLSGESIYYAVLRATNGYTAVLRQPLGTLKIPRGIYSADAVWLKKGAVEAFLIADRPLLINATAPASLVLGGPLTNSVTLTRVGRNLNMSYRLVGADGALYRLAQLDASKPPELAVYYSGKRIHSGKFVFG